MAHLYFHGFAVARGLRFTTLTIPRSSLPIPLVPRSTHPMNPSKHQLRLTGYSGSLPLIHQMLVTRTTATEIHTAEGNSTCEVCTETFG